MTILVTSGTGFIGCDFVLDWPATIDKQVLIICKLTYFGNLENLTSLLGDGRHFSMQLRYVLDCVNDLCF